MTKNLIFWFNNNKIIECGLGSIASFSLSPFSEENKRKVDTFLNKIIKENVIFDSNIKYIVWALKGTLFYFKIENYFNYRNYFFELVKFIILVGFYVKMWDF